MDSLEPRNRGERWVLYLGKKSQNKWSAPLLWLFVGVLVNLQCVWLIVQKEDILSVALFAYSSAMFFCGALSVFEQRHFYRIIQRLKENIDSLDKQQPTFHKNAQDERKQ